MKFSVITPSFNQLDYLKRCVASVADQEGVSVEHIVMDGGSTDGTVEFLKEHLANSSELKANGYSFSYASEKDDGMYDALNKGFGRASGELLAWLNCDEQYLQGALDMAKDFFKDQPKVDLLNGDALVVDPAGALLGFWKSMPLRKRYLDGGYLYNLSCAMFFRKTILSEGVLFDTSFKAAGDQELVVRLLKKGARSRVMREYFSAYTFAPENLSEQGFAKAEQAKLQNQTFGRAFSPRSVLRAMRRGERLLRGCLRQKFPLEYSLYLNGGERRESFTSDRVSPQWPGARSKHG